jgi:hypothetical protein
LGVLDTKTVFDGREKTKSESGEKKKGLRKTIENYLDEVKKEEGRR